MIRHSRPEFFNAEQAKMHRKCLLSLIAYNMTLVLLNMPITIYFTLYLLISSVEETDSMPGFVNGLMNIVDPCCEFLSRHHGIIASLVTIIVLHPYRKAFLSMIRLRTNRSKIRDVKMANCNLLTATSRNHQTVQPNNAKTSGFTPKGAKWDSNQQERKRLCGPGPVFKLASINQHIFPTACEPPVRRATR
ncbi:unnamed protein product [Gongylonema pulchrum]|uniref:G_PROTEIN_RECEP_F1_2 domain-containing protein n=1 Tax=Gongylonema pulchrum TaxID=637853 RepID=A0A183D0E0_9BILA|nr:unnamed protein product [Gongylonema pulchrum]